MATKTNEKNNKNKKTRLVLIIICVALILCALSFVLVSCLGGSSYTVTFDCLGGKINRLETVEVQVKKGKTVSKPNDPTKKYYDFLTWEDSDNNEFDFENTPINEDITLYASYKPVEYTITYELNDGVNDERNPIKYTYEDEIPLYPATRKGYSFDGWVIKNKNSSNPLEKIEKRSHGNLTLVATWSLSYFNLVVVTYDTNYGTVSLTSHNSPYAMGELYCVTATTLPYANFDGWYINDVLVSTDKTAYLIMPDHDVTIVGKFSMETYSITYILNDGVNDERNPSSYNPMSGITIYPASKEGYGFVCWKDQNGTEISYLPLGSSGDLVLTAIFAKIYTITYNLAEDETLSAGNPTSFLAGEEVELFYASKPNHSFVGWMDQDGNTYSSTIPATVEKDLILTPIFDEIGFNITYNLDGGTNDPRNPTKYNNLTAKMLYEPTKPGYTFLYWEDQNGHIYYDHTNIGFHYDIVLTAIWEPTKYSITYQYNGGFDYGSLPGPETYSAEDSTIVLDYIGMIGYTFLGWKVNDQEMIYNSFNPSEFATKYGNITLEAQWEIINFSITYNLGGGTNDSRNPTSYTYIDGSKPLYPATKEGYRFIHWVDQYGNILNEINSGFAIDLELTAVWEEEVIKDKYTLTTVVNDLVDLSIYGQNTATGDGEFAPGAEVTVTAKKSVAMFIRFVGWYLDDECVSTDLSYTFTMPKRDITLVATFTLK